MSKIFFKVPLLATHIFNKDGKSLCCKAQTPPSQLKVVVDKEAKKFSCGKCKKVFFAKNKKKPFKKIRLSQKTIWDNLPSEVQWTARNSDGSWIGFENKPVFLKDFGEWDDEKSQTVYPIQDWNETVIPEKSLQKRR